MIMPKTPKTKEYYLRKYEEAKELERKKAELHNQPGRDVEEDVKEIRNSKPQTGFQLDNNVPELLAVLGDEQENEVSFGSSLHDYLVQMWTPILTNGLRYEFKKKLMDDYPVPNNCRLLAAPKLNPELSALLQNYDNVRDERLYLAQKQLGHAISAIGKALTLLLRKDDEVHIVKHLADGCRLLNNIHCDYTKMRTVLMKKILDPCYVRLIDKQTRDEFLFGIDLIEKIKSLPQASTEVETNSRFGVDQQGSSHPSKPRFRHQNDLVRTSPLPEPRHLSHEVQSVLSDPKGRVQKDMSNTSLLESSSHPSRSTGIYRNIEITGSIGSQEVEPGISDRRPHYQKDLSISGPSESRFQSKDLQPVFSKRRLHYEEDISGPSGDPSKISAQGVSPKSVFTRSRRSPKPTRQRVLRP